MILEIMNYNYERVGIEVGEKEDIAIIIIQIVSGDEIARIIYKDYSQKEFDSAVLLGNLRCMGYDDGDYEIYNANKENNVIDNPNWQKRKTSYDGSSVAWEMERRNNE